MLASGSAAWEIILAASSTSAIVKSLPPVILNKTPLAPSIDTSKSGEEIAVLAAVIARFSPAPIPMPIRAEPAFIIIVFTSAKSTLISPGSVIKSEIPCTPCPKTESATLNASTKVIFLSTTSNNLWLGMTIKASTFSFKLATPPSAQIMRLVPSKTNGFVTTATVNAPTSLATSAIIGEAPVPVPPPIPAVIKTISAS